MYFQRRKRGKPACVHLPGCQREKHSEVKHKAFKEAASQDHIIHFNNNNNNNKPILYDTGNDKLPIGMKVTSTDCQNVKR